MDAWVRYRMRGHDYLISMVKGPFIGKWRTASTALGKVKNPLAVDALAERAHLCPEAAIALGKLGDKRAFYELIALLDDNNGNKSDVVEALGNIGDSGQ